MECFLLPERDLLFTIIHSPSEEYEQQTEHVSDSSCRCEISQSFGVAARN
jgi:hypothetical protein